MNNPGPPTQRISPSEAGGVSGTVPVSPKTMVIVSGVSYDIVVEREVNTLCLLNQERNGRNLTKLKGPTRGITFDSGRSSGYW